MKYRLTWNSSTKLSKERLYDHNVTFVFVLLLFLNIGIYYTIIPSSTGNVLYLLLGIVSLSICILKNGLKRQTPFFLFTFAYTIFGLISLLYNDNADFVELLWPLGFMGIGVIVLNFKLNTNLIKWCFYCFCLFTIVYIIMVGHVSFLRTASSRNNINVYALVYLSIYFFSCYKNREEVSLIPLILFSALCLFSIGRSGIFTAALLIVLWIVSQTKITISKRKAAKLALGFILIGIGCFLLRSMLFSQINNMIRNFVIHGLRSSRLQLWQDYIQVTLSSPANILLGAKIAGTATLNAFQDNLHNSILMLHAKYGLGGIVLVVGLMFHAFFSFLRQRNYQYLVPFIVVIFRMMLDYTNFNGLLDIVIINCLLFDWFGTNDEALC